MVNKILLVDDDPEDREIILEAFKKINAPDIIWCAQNGAIAFELLEKHLRSEVLICLIVLDLNMPKINGTQTLKNLKSDLRFKNIPVIIYSTSVNPIEKEKCLQLGAHDYITKPVTYIESLDIAKTLIHFCEPKAASEEELKTL